MFIQQYEIILYVSNQNKSRDFYSEVLNLKPSLDVEGMCEFTMSDTLKLGLMPENGIARIIGNTLPHPASGNGIPRCELYIVSDNSEFAFNTAIQNGAILISAMQDRDWGHHVGYVADSDGHIIAFAKKLN